MRSASPILQRWGWPDQNRHSVAVFIVGIEWVPTGTPHHLLAPDAGALFGLRLRRLTGIAGCKLYVWQTHKILWPQQTLRGDILVDCFPMNADASSDRLPIGSLPFGRVGQPREPHQRH